MSVAQNDTINIFRLEEPFIVEMPERVDLFGGLAVHRLTVVIAAALIQAAVEQDFKSVVECNQVSASGHFAGCAAEFDFHSKFICGKGKCRYDIIPFWYYTCHPHNRRRGSVSPVNHTPGVHPARGPSLPPWMNKYLPPSDFHSRNIPERGRFRRC